MRPRLRRQPGATGPSTLSKDDETPTADIIAQLRVGDVLPAGIPPSASTRPRSRGHPRSFYFEDRVSAKHLAWAYELSKATIYRILDLDKTRSRPTRSYLIEAGLAFHARTGILPNSVTWNRTLAKKLSPAIYLVTLERWAPHDEPTRLRMWPEQRDIVLVFGDWATYRAELQREIRRREAAGTPYVAVPIDEFERYREENRAAGLMHSTKDPEFDRIFTEAVLEARREMRREARLSRRRRRRR